VQLTLETRIADRSFASDRKIAKMEEGDVQGVHQAPEEPGVPEMVQMMRWVGFDEVQSWRVADEIGGRLSDCTTFSRSDVKVLTEKLRDKPAATRIHVNLAQAKDKSDF
jgi:hypothetical protein